MRPSLLELATYLGDRDAALPSGVQVALDTEHDFAAWAWGLSRWGQDTMARAALAAANIALPTWENYKPSDMFDGEVLGGPLFRRMLDTLAAHLANKPGAEAELAGELSLARALVERASFYVEEASGDNESVMRRRKALAAARAALAAVETAMWSEAEVQRESSEPGVDAAEVAARAAAGPALHVVHALSFACLATDATSARIRAELRRVLL